MKNYFDFLLAMTEKEIKVRYKGATFGFMWMVINPVLQMLVIGFVFSFFIEIPNYYLFLLTGLLPWFFFSRSVSKATSSIVDERALLQKAKFPINAIPVSIILANFLHLLISILILSIFLLITGVLFFPQILLLIPALIWLALITIGISLFSATLQVRYREVNFFVQTLLVLWFYATPVLYELTLIPPKLRYLFALNPLTTIFELFHSSFLNRGLIDGQIVILNLLFSVIIMALGIGIFRKQKKYFVDRL
jgi:ABC-2 type transport system permease protein